MSFTIKGWQEHHNRNNLSDSDCGGFILVDIMLHDATKYECECAIFKLNILLRFGDYEEKKWAKNQMERIFLHGKCRRYDGNVTKQDYRSVKNEG